MANENNLIRPSILNIPTPNPQAPSHSNQNLPNASNANNIDMNVITRICEQAISRILNPNSEISGIDQEIEDRYRDNLTELDKIPDAIRGLREFSGNPSEYSSWKKSVERILRLYEPCKGTPKYFGILNTIRNKIVGSADAALEAYNTPLNWECISKCLTLHYADKRDLTTLEYQMTSLIQGNNSIQNFYQEVYSHLSLIMNKLSCLEISRESMDLLTQTYRDKALDTFIRGLQGDLPKLLAIKEPTDLPQALQLCLKLQNQQFRTNYANSHQISNKLNKSTPHIPPRRNQEFASYRYVPSRIQPQQEYYYNAMPQQHIQSQQQYFHYPTPQRHPLPHQQFPHTAMPQRKFPTSHQFQPQRPTAPKPLPQPEPMDIDQSIGSKKVNYMNRPVQNDKFFGKRPNPTYNEQQPNKIQRNFHIDTEEGVIPQEYQEQIESYESQEDLVEFSEYLNNQYDTARGNIENEEVVEDLIDINFLD